MSAPAVGVVYALTEQDYQFGTGPLLCQVMRVLRRVVYDNEPWWDVEAMVKPPGTVGSAHGRRIYLRDAAMTQVSRPTTMPDGF